MNETDSLILDLLKAAGEPAPGADLAYRVRTEKDFIVSKRYDYSLDKLLARYGEEPVPERVIAQVLGLSDEMETREENGEEVEVSVAVEEIYRSAVTKLQAMMGVSERGIVEDDEQTR
jgi:hypothetical protein